MCVTPALAQSKSPPAELPHWGQVHSPNRKVQFKVTDDALELTLPSGANDFSIELGRITAPRVLQAVSGDFSIQVQVARVTPPGTLSTTPGRRPFCSAGLLVWQDAGNYIRLEHARCLVPPQVMNYANWELRSQGQWVRQGRFDEQPMDGEASWLRIARRGTVFSAGVSSDGEAWKSLPDITAAWPADLQAGIVAVNDTRIAFKPSFRKLSLTTP
jgi:regulation of enolase protein 1 (concanavalin A-like superfamily)